MPILKSTPPASSVAALELGMASMESGTSAVQMASAREPGFAAQFPVDVFVDSHRNYFLGAREIADNCKIDRAEPVGWRYLVRSNDNTLMGADVQADANAHFFAGLNIKGPFNQGIADALLRLDSEPAVQSGSFEPRLLRAPALQLVAICLKDMLGSNDLVLPVPPLPRILEPGKIYSPESLLSILRPAAQAVLDFDTTPREE